MALSSTEAAQETAAVALLEASLQRTDTLTNKLGGLLAALDARLARLEAIGTPVHKATAPLTVTQNSQSARVLESARDRR